MYNLFNTLRPPNLTLFNLPCSFQPNDMDGRARKAGGGGGRFRKKVWLYRLITTHYHRWSCVFNILLVCASLPHSELVWKLMQASFLTAGYIEGGEICIDQVYKTPMILL